MYAFSTAPEEQEKTRIGLEILQAQGLAVSVQVLQEFCVQATRPAKPDRISHDQAVLLIEAYLRFPVQEVTVSLMQPALAAKERFRISFWDTAVVEAARTLGCHTLLTEDLSDGQNYDGVRIKYPFQVAP